MKETYKKKQLSNFGEQLKTREVDLLRQNGDVSKRPMMQRPI